MACLDPVLKNARKHTARLTHAPFNDNIRQVNEGGAAGISNVEWDAVELPSQVIEERQCVRV